MNKKVEGRSVCWACDELMELNWDKTKRQLQSSQCLAQGVTYPVEVPVPFVTSLTAAFQRSDTSKEIVKKVAFFSLGTFLSDEGLSIGERIANSVDKKWNRSFHGHILKNNCK